MARWVKLTAASDKKCPIYVNLDSVTYLISSDHGTEVWFAGHDEAKVIVTEEPDAVVAMRTL